MEPTSIRLPPDLLPDDGRFGSGPSKIRREALDRLTATPLYLGTSHRRDPVRSVVQHIRAGMGELFGLPEGYEVVLGNGGATAFWDAATFRLIEQRSLHYVFGAFSGRFAAVVAAAPHLRPPVLVEGPVGSRPEPVGADGVDLVALTHNETSTGVMMPVTRPEGDALVAVDATSAAGAVEVDPAAFDVYYFSPQKAFGSEGGLWVALCSPAALERIASLQHRWSPPFLDLALAVDESRRNQTLNTPALATLFLLADQIDWLAGRGGIAAAAARCRDTAAVIYRWAEASPFATPFVVDAAHRSPTVATIDLAPEIAASAVASALDANGIVDVEGYRKLGHNQLRIAVYPNVEPGDVARLLAAVDYVVAALGPE
ncbi:MAG TPA: phosphoserine transaminase [Gemmatimonadales bacterium]|nr:phosphoserine transaminase [Gemmatimonadales bacterium]